ncbi:hypothetical protein B0H63DRAFT_396245 [Podospora didyma]|uniref:Rhodopsin domain-containing protein n=1 Tax=Podospora didyma TaxID=330526 RepID=A0AAE0NGS5_9PEZI|nr:hypothetical protein B0H63DRAFT_396245 [Podospora didyma]
MTGATGGGGGGGGGPPLGAIPGANDNLGEKIDIIVWTLVALSGVILGLRIWCKCAKQRGLWWDDNILIVAWLFLIASAVIGSVNRSLGFGRHVFAVNPANFPAIGLNGNLAATFSIFAAVWSKTSFALTMLRLVQGPVTKSFVWFVIITMNLAMYITIAFTWTRCTPPDKLQQCIDSNVYVSYSIFSGSYSAAMDFILAFLPWPLVWGLQMRKQEKLGVALAMSLGVFAGITAIMKCIAIPTLAHGDFTYDGAELVIWGDAEVATTIMATSIPVLRVLFIDAKTSAERHYGGSRSKRMGGSSSGLQSRYNTIISANKDRDGSHRLQVKGSDKTIRAGAADDGSDKSILDGGNKSHAGKIVQVNEVRVEFSERGVHEESEGWYEMTDVEVENAASSKAAGA